MCLCFPGILSDGQQAPYSRPTCVESSANRQLDARSTNPIEMDTRVAIDLPHLPCKVDFHICPMAPRCCPRQLLLKLSANRSFVMFCSYCFIWCVFWRSLLPTLARWEFTRGCGVCTKLTLEPSTRRRVSCQHGRVLPISWPIVFR